MLDGTPTLRMNEFILAGLESGVIPLELPEGEQNSSSMPQPEEVSFDLDEKMMGYIDNAKKGFGDEMAQQDVKVSSTTLTRGSQSSLSSSRATERPLSRSTAPRPMPGPKRPNNLPSHVSSVVQP